MHLPEAYAISLGKEISCEVAEYRFWRDKTITSKYDFRCGPNCTARVTCVNLEKPKDQRRVQPYFKIYGEHSENCETWEKIKEQPTRYRKSNKQRQHQIRLTKVYDFDPTPPNQVKKTIAGGQPSNSVPSGYQEQSSNNQGLSNRDQNPKARVYKMVDLYDTKQFNEEIRFRTNKKKKNYIIKKIKKIFVAVNGQDTKTIDDHSVLHGLATVEEDRPKGEEGPLESYLCRFVAKLSMEKEGEDIEKITQQPTLFVPLTALELAGELAGPKSKGKILQQAVAAGSTVAVYFYIADPDGKFIPRKGFDNINIEFDENNNDIHNLIIQKQSVSWLHKLFTIFTLIQAFFGGRTDR